MKAYILAGGLGTRLNKEIPKALTFINNEPIIGHQINQFLKYNISDITCILGYKSEQVKNYLNINHPIVKIIVEKERLGTGGMLCTIKNFETDIIVTYCDIYFKINIDNIIDQFQRNNTYDSLLFVHPNNHPHDSDVLLINHNNRLRGIRKKNTYQNRPVKNITNAGFFLFRKNYFINEKGNTKTNLEEVIKNNIKLNNHVYLSCEYMKDMGTPQRLNEVNTDINNGKGNRLSGENKRIAVFLDRDGVINKEKGRISKIEEFEIYKNIHKPIKKLNDQGILVIVITNQPVIARGDINFHGLKMIHNKLEYELGRNGAYIDDILFCPHHPDKGFHGEIEKYKIRCDCRKPNTKMLDDSILKYNIDINKSFFIGDSTTDYKLSTNANINFIGVKTGHGLKDGKYKIERINYINNLNEFNYDNFNSL